MSRENVEVVRDLYAEFAVTHRASSRFPPDFIWDMSNFRGWPDQAEYRGPQGFNEFITNWLEAWDDWEQEVEDLIDTPGDEVVAVEQQRGIPKSGGPPVTMRFANVWTIRDGSAVRVRCYADVAEALDAVGLSERDLRADSS
jgi:ketosteroid isomerase-like protein